MNERNKHDEVFWDDLLEEIDLEVGDLAAAEARMSAAEDVELAPGQAERMVRHATHGVPVLKLREPKANPFRRWLRAAVILMGSSTTLTVGTVAAATTVVAVYLVWSEGQRSAETMSDEMALELLWQPEQPDQDRISATLKVATRAELGILALKAIRDDQSEPPPLAQLAGDGLSRLLMLLEVYPPQRLPGRFQDAHPAAEMAKDRNLPIESRALQIERLIVSAGTAIGELRCMPTQAGAVRTSRDKKLDRLRHQITR